MDKVITRLVVQKRNPNRVNLFLDGEYSFGLSRNLLGFMNVGDILDDRKIAKLQDEDGIEVAYQKALKFIAFKPRTENEVRQKLKKAGYAEEVYNPVIERVKNAGYIDDTQYSNQWIEGRTVRKQRSQWLITKELRQKGIPEEEIKKGIGNAPPDIDLAYEAAKSQIKKLSHIEYDQFRKKLSGFLARRGFGYEIVSETVKRVWSETNDAGENY